MFLFWYKSALTDPPEKPPAIPLPSPEIAKGAVMTQCKYQWFIRQCELFTTCDLSSFHGAATGLAAARHCCSGNAQFRVSTAVTLC